jgi:hypothetical protein
MEHLSSAEDTPQKMIIQTSFSEKELSLLMQGLVRLSDQCRAHSKNLTGRGDMPDEGLSTILACYAERNAEIQNLLERLYELYKTNSLPTFHLHYVAIVS